MNVLELKRMLEEMKNENYIFTNSKIENNLLFLDKNNNTKILDEIPSLSTLGIRESEFTDYLNKYNLMEIKHFNIHKSTIKKDIEKEHIFKKPKKILYRIVTKSTVKLDVLHSIHMNLMSTLSCYSVKCGIDTDDSIKDNLYKIELLIFN